MDNIASEQEPVFTQRNVVQQLAFAGLSKVLGFLERQNDRYIVWSSQHCMGPGPLMGGYINTPEQEQQFREAVHTMWPGEDEATEAAQV